jgi:GGDEF domain-containing protein
MSTQEIGNAGESRRTGNVTDESVFRFLLDLELQKAVRLQYCVSLVLVSLEPGTRPANGGEAGDAALTRQVAESVAPHLRATDVVAALPGRALGVLLIDAETGSLPAIIDRATEGWRARPVAGQARGLSWSAGGGCFPLTATNATGLMRQASDLMTRARAEGGDRLYLPT